MRPRRPPDGHTCRSGDVRGDGRAVSDLVGFVLVFSLIASVVAVVSLAGLSSLQDARDAQQTDNAERALEVLSDNMGDMTERGAPSRATEVSLADASLSLGDETLIEVRDPRNSGDPSFLRDRVFKVRPIVYEDDRAKLVYANGAVFRQERDGGVVLQPWEPVLDGDRTMIPVVNTGSSTGGPQLIKTSTVLVRANTYQRVVPVTDDTGVYDNVWVNVTSSRAHLWERMLEADGDFDCTTVSPERIECALQYTPDRIYVVETRISVALKK